MSFAIARFAPGRPLAQGPGFLGPLGQASYGPFSGAKDTLAKMAEVVHGPGGERHPAVRQFTEWVVREIEPKDYNGEIVAVRNVFLQESPARPGAPLFRYTNDPRHIEWVKRPSRIVGEINDHGSALVDCDDVSAFAATMLMQLGREAEFVAIGFAGQLTHVGTRAREPKSGQWIWMDPVAGPREREAIERAKQVLIWRLD